MTSEGEFMFTITPKYFYELTLVTFFDHSGVFKDNN